MVAKMCDECKLKFDCYYPTPEKNDIKIITTREEMLENIGSVIEFEMNGNRLKGFIFHSDVYNVDSDIFVQVYACWELTGPHAEKFPHNTHKVSYLLHSLYRDVQYIKDIVLVYKQVQMSAEDELIRAFLRLENKKIYEYLMSL